MGPGWSVRVNDHDVTVVDHEQRVTIAETDAGSLKIRRGLLRRSLCQDGARLVWCRGLSKSDASNLSHALAQLGFQLEVAAAITWHGSALIMFEEALRSSRWISREAVDAIIAQRPTHGLATRIQSAGIVALLSDSERAAVAFLDEDLPTLVATANSAVISTELRARQQFFAAIEKTPLTEEQARAVICFDNRVQLLAPAGSGKTSVMVARAAYAVSRGFVSPDRILLLAFNKSAAVELQERVDSRFAAAGISAGGVRASTFHSLGLDVIGTATGAKPQLASWLDTGDDTGLRMVELIVDEFRDRDEQFRYHWDLYRLLYAHAPAKLVENNPDTFDPQTREPGYRTFRGEVVRSHGERLIANWLYLYGVNYIYEMPYPHKTSSADRSQYRPDFYYPDIDVWHEHWALDRDGEPPDSFVGYADDMVWKRKTHQTYGTTLIETSWADVVWGDGLTQLQRQLEAHGQMLDWNPDRTIADHYVKPMKHSELYGTMRTFMAHIKSNSFTAGHIEDRLAGELSHVAGTRTSIFLNLYWAIAAEWDRRLAMEESVDFEDMLIQAADHLEEGRADLGYDLILVDEFQDASHARARLVRGLLARPSRYLLAVGDDWQSINRFAGADMSVMTDFAEWFGPGPQLALTTTFRCPQSICDTASSFITKNPLQFSKLMRSAQSSTGVPIDVIRSSHPREALTRHLSSLSASMALGASEGRGDPVSVFILGRYNFDREFLPARDFDHLEVSFRTVHSSKGLEADFIVLPNMVMGTYGFPAAINNDPVFAVAMSKPETYEYAEERRLFYVAITRARRAVTIITDPTRISTFVVELLSEGRVTVNGATPKAGGEDDIELCPRCGTGVLVPRKGPYGKFLACTNYRTGGCKFTRPLNAKRWVDASASRPSAGYRPGGTSRRNTPRTRRRD
jgi:DNA helicase IV